MDLLELNDEEIDPNQTFFYELWDTHTENLIMEWASPDLRAPLGFIRGQIEGLSRAEAEQAVKNWLLVRWFGESSSEWVAEGVELLDLKDPK